LRLYVSIDSHESNGAGFSHCERDIFKLDTN
jgi:hypothetical protein